MDKAMLYGSTQPKKDKTEVEVTFVNGVSMRGHFYVSRTQRVADVLNDTRSFIPFEDVSNAIRLVNKAAIVEVKPTEATDEERRRGFSFV